MDGTQVYPSGDQNIKLTRENPYFSLSGSYTLEVNMPMNILENRRFFGNICRMDVLKRHRTMTCRLLVDNKMLMNGTARITQVTDQDVKVQLLAGNSEINFLSEDDALYIDELQYPAGRVMAREVTMYWDIMSFYGKATVPRLIDIVTEVLRASGFTVTENFLDREPWRNIYITTDQNDAAHFEKTLPHWKASEFIREISYLFNVTFKADAVTKNVRILSNISYVEDAQLTELDVLDEYKVEINEDSEDSGIVALSNANIRYSLVSSEDNDMACLEDDVRNALETKEYDSFESLDQAWRTMPKEERSCYVFACPQGHYASWVGIPLAKDTPAEEKLTYIDCFRPLVRDSTNKDGEQELKIVPVGVHLWAQKFGAIIPYFYIHAPVVDGPADETVVDYEDEATEKITVQDAVENGVDSSENASSDDVMQVMFVDGKEQLIIRQDVLGDKVNVLYGIAGFTDWLLKPGIDGTLHDRWSMSLNPTQADHYIGELHHNSYSFNMDAKYCCSFISDVIPDPGDIFVFHGKHYACEKIEANIKDGQLDRLMTGYFYEILPQ